MILISVLILLTYIIKYRGAKNPCKYISYFSVYVIRSGPSA